MNGDCMLCRCRHVYVHMHTWADFSLQFFWTFQKRLFIEPYVDYNDPVECDLVFHQLIQDVFEERIPITPTHAVSTELLACYTKFPVMISWFTMKPIYNQWVLDVVW